ncbi:MAG TPA: cation-translocating P-type ATPase, partial [Verrucomicrobiae bacterium]|nr:cation-translocating P-type ATPase [Verrucomicrobiae bacterium]
MFVGSTPLQIAFKLRVMSCGCTSDLALPGTTELRVTGMTCNNCARHVTEAIQSVPEVASASVQLDAGRAVVRWRDGANVEGVLRAVAEAGYEAKPIEEKASAKTKWSPLMGWRFNVVVGLICTVPLLIGEWAFHLGMARWFQWVAFALALPVQIFCGARFYNGAWRQLKAGLSNMDTLVALGSTTAFGYSVWALFAGMPGHLYFMEAAAIITIISLGHWAEARTSERAESALHALLHLAPEMARRRNTDGSESEVPVRELRLNDTVILKPGDHVPVDGEVTDGAGAVDEAMLTGESLPVEKKPGDKLYAGTVNQNGRIFLRVTATGEQTALAHIIAAVARAQNSRAEIQRLGDRVSSVFVPVVVLIALGTGLWWGFGGEHARQTSAWLANFLWPVILPTGALTAAVIQAAAVLIIACPCAMGLATPVAIMAGANAAARRGILVRDGVALERAGKITAIVFDKTGTLTQGKPEVAAQEIYSSADDAMKWASALARRSNHPLSQAVAKLHQDEFAFEDFEEVRGAGVQGIADCGLRSADLKTGESADFKSEKAVLRLGSVRWLQEAGVDLGPGKNFAEKWSAQ